MDNFFASDNAFFKFTRRICDIFVLHFLWVLFSLPIITFGASTTALYYTAMKGIQIEDGYIVKRFWKSFKENLKQSTLIWLIFVGVGIVFSVDMYFGYIHRFDSYGKPLMFIFTILICLYVFIFLYVWPLQAKFSNNIPTTIRNAFVLSIRYFPWTLLLIAHIGLVIFSLFVVPIFGIYCLLMGGATYAYITSFIYLHIFKPFLPKERDIHDEEFRSEHKEEVEAALAEAQQKKSVTPPKKEEVKKETPKKEEPKKQTPKKTSLADRANAVSKVEEKVEAEESAKKEKPKAEKDSETPKKEEPKKEAPKTQNNKSNNANPKKSQGRSNNGNKNNNNKKKKK